MDENMQIAIRWVVIKLGLANYGILSGRVGSHYFRAGGGVMALKFSGADRGDIKQMVRWSSDIFLICIRDQIAEYFEGWAKKIVTLRSYFNLEGAFA